MTTRVECAECFDLRDRALLAHATQVDPDGTWFQVPREVQARVWPTEDYEAGRVLRAGRRGEDDLFAGLGDVGPRGRRARDHGLAIAIELRGRSGDAPRPDPDACALRAAAPRDRRRARASRHDGHTPSRRSIGPGLGAFIAFFVLALALWLLMRNMNARMRRMAYREQQRPSPTAEAAGEAERDGSAVTAARRPARRPGVDQRRRAPSRARATSAAADRPRSLAGGR